MEEKKKPESEKTKQTNISGTIRATDTVENILQNGPAEKGRQQFVPSPRLPLV
jgi:hypothetical protein